MTIYPVHGRLSSIAVLAALAAAAPLGAAHAHTTGATEALCASQFTATVTPGFSTTPSSGTLTTNGETGEITCVGEVRGKRITGPGLLGVEQTHDGATCQSATGTGTVSVTLPTTAGDRHLIGKLSVRRTGLAVSVNVRFPGARYHGSGVAIPQVGNCVVTPLTQVMVVQTGTLSGPRGT